MGFWEIPNVTHHLYSDCMFLTPAPSLLLWWETEEHLGPVEVVYVEPSLPLMQSVFGPLGGDEASFPGGRLCVLCHLTI